MDGETTDPCADSFALDEVGCVLLSTLRDWPRDFPTMAVLGIARSTIRFTANVIQDPDYPDTADTLEAMRDERWYWRTRSTPHPIPTGSRTTVEVGAEHGIDRSRPVGSTEPPPT
ncbi:hypothetical protein [Streptomyces fumanus]|uniref:Uncharacterized protein n=1 Tax=Streptomyces fumanus TaxID=67302 RepID=A0A919AYU8_9ACTN|nr:hypothetical protein [Streptomyces fumanus]GHF33208.1 hypothetical protein GCM10018772_68540 [Streptomyces fumanus]